MKITVVGIGYVGLSLAVLLAQRNCVIAYDTNVTRIGLLNNKKSHLLDDDISSYLENGKLELCGTTDPRRAYSGAELVIIATPTDYNPETNYFNTESIEYVIREILEVNKKALILIKSTVPIGFTRGIKNKFNYDKIIFSPEFLREGSALQDNLYPSRIVIGEKSDDAVKISRIFEECALKSNVDVLFTNSCEAEAIKLFANTYLAMRVGFFNELDTFASIKNLNVREIIEGVGFDPRIGNHYNNPSFGYGGYCLPKDSKQLLYNFNDVPQSLMSAIVKSNEIRKKFITESVLKRTTETVGVYRLIMKQGSDNFRSSSVHDVITSLKDSGVEILVYEPAYDFENDFGYEIINELSEFKNRSDLIIANRVSDELTDVLEKVYSRDVFENN